MQQAGGSSRKLNSALTNLALPHEERVIRTAIRVRGKHDLILGGSLQSSKKNSAAPGAPGGYRSGFNTRTAFGESHLMHSLPLNDPGTLLERQARTRTKWQSVLAAKEENMHRKQADMKAMLAKGFKKERA